MHKLFFIGITNTAVILSLIIGGCVTTGTSGYKDSTTALRDNYFQWLDKKYDLVFTAIQSEQYQTALKEIQNKRLKEKKPSAQTYIYEGYVYLKLQDYKTAIEKFNQSVSLNTNRADGPGHVLFHRAYANYRDGRYQEAVNDVEKVLNHRWAIDSTRRFYHAIGQPAYTEVEARVNLLFTRGNSYHKLKKYDLALADFNQVEKIDANHVVTNLTAGMKADVYFDLADYDKAEEQIILALGYQKNPYYLNRYGLILLMKGKFSTAKEQFSLAVKQKNDEIYRYNYAMSLWLSGQQNEGLAMMLDVLQKMPFADGYYHAGYFLHKSGNDVKANSYFKKAQELNAMLLENRLQALNRVPVFSPTRKIYQEEYEIARNYLIKRSEVHVSKAVTIEFKQLVITPEIVTVGEKFYIEFTYNINLPNQPQANVNYYFKILKGKKTLFTSKSKLSLTSRGIGKSIKIPMTPVKKPGEYTVTVFLEYEKASAMKSTQLMIQ